MTTDPTILFVKPGAISSDDKTALSGAGVIVVEIENPQDVKFVRAGAELSSTELLSAAASAIAIGTTLNSGNEIKRAFASYVCAAIAAKHPLPEPTP